MLMLAITLSLVDVRGSNCISLRLKLTSVSYVLLHTDFFPYLCSGIDSSKRAFFLRCRRSQGKIDNSFLIDACLRTAGFVQVTFARLPEPSLAFLLADSRASGQATARWAHRQGRQDQSFRPTIHNRTTAPDCLCMHAFCVNTLCIS